MKNKKAIELSINFLVILIIAIVVFGFGLYLTFRFFGSAQEIPEEISTQLEQDTIRMLSHGEKVAIPVNQQTIQGGKHFVFSLGISNMLDGKKTFSLDISLSKFIDSENIVHTAVDSDPALFNSAKNSLKIINQPHYTLDNGEQKVIPVAVSAAKNAPSGTYIINVSVTYLDESLIKDYAPLQKIYVTVP